MFSMGQSMPYAKAKVEGDGKAFSAFYTDRFYPEDVVGKVVVIHAMPDDFKSQPPGNPGNIVACGKIQEI